MRRFAAALFLSMICGPAGGLRAQSSSDPVARSAGGIWLRPATDPWGALGATPVPAPAGSLSAGAAYFAPAWGLAGLATSAAVAEVGLAPGTIGVSLSRFGSSLYSETEAGCSWSAAAGPVSYAASVRGRYLSVERHGAAWTPRLDLAAAVSIGGWSSWGVRVTDVNRGAVGRSGERLQPRLSFAAAISPPGWPALLLQAGDEPDGFGIRAGLILELNRLSVRAGTSGAFDRIHAGVGVPVGLLEAGYGVVVHPVLGWSHAFWVSVGAGR